MLNRLAALPAIVGFLVCASLVSAEATRLRVTGAWTLWLTCAILVAAAVGLVAGQLWAYVYGLLYWIVGTLGLATLAVVVAWQAATHKGGGEWAGVATLLMAGIALVCLIAGAASGVAAAALGFGWRARNRSHSPIIWVLSVSAALAGLGLVAWLAGYRYGYLQLRAQNQCLGGAPHGCSMLVTDANRYPKPQRLMFAVHGCRAGDDTVCRQLSELLDAGHTAASEEVRAIDLRCQAGNPDMCRRLGVHLSAIGDAASGARFFERTCAIDARWCEAAAKAAATARLDGLSLTLLQQGCERDDAPSCRALLRDARAARPAVDVTELEIKTCLVGDVNDCTPLMRRELRGVCSRVCEGTSENRMQSCTHCGREAEAAGEPALAEAWFAGACQKGNRLACDELSRLRAQSRAVFIWP